MSGVGIGLHKGEPIKITLEPLEANSGIVFYRSDGTRCRLDRPALRPMALPGSVRVLVEGGVEGPVQEVLAGWTAPGRAAPHPPPRAA